MPSADPQLAYFAGYVMWTYFNLPFVAALPGVDTEQLEDWQERGETWHRLRFMSPGNIATHSRVQTLYVDETGILKRHNYDVDIAAGTAAAHYVSDYVEVRQHVSPTPPKRLSFAIAVY